MKKDKNLQKNDEKIAKNDEKIAKNDKNQEKNAKNQTNGNDKKANKKEKHIGTMWLLGISFLSIGLLLFCQFFYGNAVNDKTTFYKNTHINGVDVSGLNKYEAANVVSAKMLDSVDEISISLDYGDKKWQLSGSDFEFCSDIAEQLVPAISYGREGNFIEKTKISNKIKKEGFNYNISYAAILGNLENKVDEIAMQIDKDYSPSQVIFQPDKEETFAISKSQEGVKVDKEKLLELLNQSLKEDKVVNVEIPTIPVLPNEPAENIAEKIALRSSFTTNYSTSSAQRKNNIKLALSKFNGMIVEPGQEVSFNEVTGLRNEENGYQKANIIKNGVFVEGSGGGVCQASTTLYNALVLSDIEIIDVNHHSLPVSYVPLSRDAMVSEGYADLVFKNNTDSPIYIKAYGDNSNATVEIYGAKFDDGVTLKIKSELVSIIAHGGDKVVEDISGEYADKVLYKGEYYRVKYPKEGYETKSYLQRYENGELKDEKLLRHDYYWPQDGVVVEGYVKIGEGMTLPNSEVKLIPAQKVTPEHLQNMKNKFSKTYPDAFEA